MAENIEKKTEKKRIRFNVVDIIIIVAVIACIGGVALRVALSNSFKNSNMKDYVVTFKAEGLSYSQYLGIKQAIDEADKGGNFVSFADNHEKIGKLYGITESELLYIESHNGNHVYFEVGENDVNTEDGDDSWKEDSIWLIKGTIVCSGENSDENGFLLNGDTFIAANQTIEVATKYVQFDLKITGIELYK